MNPDLSLIGRTHGLFDSDIIEHDQELRGLVRASKFLVIGGAGSIGQAVVKEIFKRDPLALHVVDISENNLVELVRDIRSSLGYSSGEFLTFAIDVGSLEFGAMVEAHGPYDFVLNLSALKHVRSESDPYTLMRLIDTNIFNTLSSFRRCNTGNLKKYFCVSTDKAANPVNLMGASKRIMELFMMREVQQGNASMARFANVAFSDGSLLHGFNMRLQKKQPISAPDDVRRYFVTHQEAGELCLLSAIYGTCLDIFFPKLAPELNLMKFSDVASEFLRMRGYEPHLCASEEEARARVNELARDRKWPVYFFQSDTTGEKDFEEFYTSHESVNWDSYKSIGIVRNDAVPESVLLDEFEQGIMDLRARGIWSKKDLVSFFGALLPNFDHLETGKYLDDKM